MTARWWLRTLAAWLLGVALVVTSAYTLNAIYRADRELSAVQVIQVYAEGVFLALTLIGLALAVYIGTRAGE